MTAKSAYLTVFSLVFLSQPALCTPVTIGACPSCFPSNYVPFTMATATLQTDSNYFQATPVTYRAGTSGALEYIGNLGSFGESLYAVGFSGIHLNLSANAAESSDQGAIAYANGNVVDYLDFQNFAPGSTATFYAGFDGFGEVAVPKNSNEMSLAYVQPSLMLNSVPSAECASLGQYVSGSVSVTCSESVAIPQSGIVSLDLQYAGQAFATYGGEASLDLLNTGYISSVQVFDAGGNAEYDGRIYSASGYNYNAAATPVSATPELSSFALLTTGLIPLSELARRKLQPRS